MFNNPNPNEDILPNTGDLEVGNGMQNVEINQYNRLETPVKLNPETATFDDIALHGLLRQRLSTGTVNRNLRYLRFMETHQQPVDFRQPTYENYIQHMDYREQIEKSGWGALKHQKQAFRMFLLAIGENPSEWYYKPPSRQQTSINIIPLPDQVHKILHTKYSKDFAIDSNIKHLLSKNFIYGWRVPSEPIQIKTSDVNLETETLTLFCPKTKRKRIIDISEMATRKTTFSFKNLIDKIRPKIINQHSKDYLFLNPNGEPFENPDQLRMYLNREVNPTIKKIFPEYNNYKSRSWCTISRLIRTKVESKKFDEYDVMQFIDHIKIETTIGYLKSAKFYYNKAPFDWIKCVLKNHKKMVEENTLETTNGKNTPLYFGFPSVDLSRRLSALNTFLEGISNYKNLFFAHVVFCFQSLIKPFLFSLCRFLFSFSELLGGGNINFLYTDKQITSPYNIIETGDKKMLSPKKKFPNISILFSFKNQISALKTCRLGRDLAFHPMLSSSPHHQSHIFLHPVNGFFARSPSKRQFTPYRLCCNILNLLICNRDCYSNTKKDVTTLLQISTTTI